MHDDEKLTQARKAIADRGPKAGSVWLHVKTGHKYRVIHCGVNEGDLVPTVAYRRAGAKTGLLWFRPLDQFTDGRFQTTDPPPRKPRVKKADAGGRRLRQTLSKMMAGVTPENTPAEVSDDPPQGSEQI